MLILGIARAALRQPLQINLLAFAAHVVHLHLGLLLPPGLLRSAHPAYPGLLDDLLDDVLLFLFDLQLSVLQPQVFVLFELVVEGQEHGEDHDEADDGDDGVYEQDTILLHRLVARLLLLDIFSLVLFIHLAPITILDKVPHASLIKQLFVAQHDIIRRNLIFHLQMDPIPGSVLFQAAIPPHQIKLLDIGTGSTGILTSAAIS